MDALYLNYLCKQCHYTCVETINHFRLHPTSITDLCKVLHTSFSSRFLSVMTAAGEDDFIGTLNFGTSRLYVAGGGGAVGMSNFSMAGTSNFGTSTLGSANVGMLDMSNFGIENNGTSTLGMLNLGAVSGTLNAGMNNGNDVAGLGGGGAGTLNFGGEVTSIWACGASASRRMACLVP